MKHIVWVRYILMLLSVLAIVFGWSIASQGKAAGDFAMEDSGTNILLSWMYVMMVVGVGAMLLMSVFSLAQNPKSALRSLIGLALILIIIGVAWTFSDSAEVVTPTDVYTEAISLKVADTSLFAVYACLAVAIVSIVVLEIRNAFR